MILRPSRPTLFPYTTLFRSLLRLLEQRPLGPGPRFGDDVCAEVPLLQRLRHAKQQRAVVAGELQRPVRAVKPVQRDIEDRKSTRLNSSHSQISYAVFCLKKN